ncbi:hypothetical protein FXO38_21556 [Capsicum annuum]|nr:hypothetical protein FXO38_21556 [Capsicum annuum]
MSTIHQHCNVRAEGGFPVCEPYRNFNSAVYAYGRVIVHVTSKVPLAMDILIAELNKVCIFTVPKYIVYSEAAFQSKEAYYKAIGYA